MTLFTEQINNWDDWSKVFQSIPAFTPLVEHILYRERLPLAHIEHLTPGTNAVFKVGNYVVKVFAPTQSGMDQTIDLQTELFAAKRVNMLGVSAPTLVAHGFVEDQYRFAYMITEYINGAAFTEAVKTMTDNEKINIGKQLRFITDRINTPCAPFNNMDVTNVKTRELCQPSQQRWEKYAERFKTERIAYINAASFGEKVFVHGDLCGDNLLLTSKGDIYIIDFADAVLAPVVYEHALVAVELFDCDPALLRGYFGAYTVDELVEVCFNGLLIHDFGGDIVHYRIGKADMFQTLDDLKDTLKAKINNAVVPFGIGSAFFSAWGVYEVMPPSPPLARC